MGELSCHVLSSRPHGPCEVAFHGSLRAIRIVPPRQPRRLGSVVVGRKGSAPSTAAGSSHAPLAYDRLRTQTEQDYATPTSSPDGVSCTSHGKLTQQQHSPWWKPHRWLFSTVAAWRGVRPPWWPPWWCPAGRGPLPAADLYPVAQSVSEMTRLASAGYRHTRVEQCVLMYRCLLAEEQAGGRARTPARGARTPISSTGRQWSDDMRRKGSGCIRAIATDTAPLGMYRALPTEPDPVSISALTHLR